jgi:hypothetical protein
MSAMNSANSRTKRPNRYPFFFSKQAAMHMLFFVCVLLPTIPAFGQSILLTQTLDYDALSPNFNLNETLAFNRFNTNLGTLNSVTITYEARTTNGAQIQYAPNLSPPIDVDFDYDISVGTTLLFLNYPNVFDGAAGSANGSFTLPPNGSFNTPLVFSEIEALGPAGDIQFFRSPTQEWNDVLAAFSVAGIGTFNVRATAMGGLALTSPLFNDDTISRIIQTSPLAGSGAEFEVNVAYAFTPTGLPDDGGGGVNPNPPPIPEPSTMLLSGLGIAALFAAKRRSKKSPVSPD